MKTKYKFKYYYFANSYTLGEREIKGQQIFRIFRRKYHRGKLKLHKYKVKEIYRVGECSYRANPYTKFEQYYDSMDKVWEDNSWPYDIFKDIDHNISPEKSWEYPYSFVMKFKNDDDAILWFELNHNALPLLEEKRCTN